MAEFDTSSGFFTAFRQDYGFPYFEREETIYFLRSLGLWVFAIAYILVVLALTVILAFLGTRGYSRWRVALQMLISLSIGFSIIVAVTGHGWQRADHEMAEMDGEKATYSLRVGLRQANITMFKMNTANKTIIQFHNVKIGWSSIDQAEQEYREALVRGWPLGILRIAHYMSVDVGEMRYMRDFRWSGYMAYILLWFAFCSWLLANLIVASNISTAAASLLLTGVVQIIACIVYHDQQPKDFYIPLDDGQNHKLRLGYDWMFWLTCFTGIFGVLLAIILMILNYLRPADMNKFFGTHSEILSPYDEELNRNKNKDIKGLIRGMSTKRSAQKKVSIDSEAKTIPRHPSLKRRGKTDAAVASGYLAEEDTPIEETKGPTFLNMELRSLNGPSRENATLEQEDHHPVEAETEIIEPGSKEPSPVERKKHAASVSSASEGSRSPLMKPAKDEGQTTPPLPIEHNQEVGSDGHHTEMDSEGDEIKATADEQPPTTANTTSNE